MRCNPARTDPGAAVSLQLEPAVGDRGDYPVEFYFRPYPDTVRAEVIDFLGPLLRHPAGQRPSIMAAYVKEVEPRSIGNISNPL